MRRLRTDEVKFHYSIQQDDMPYVGNISASGDDEHDKEAEDEIEQRLDAGDVLAWFTIVVEARWWSPINELHQGTAVMGGCNYAPNTPLEEIVEDLGLRGQAVDSLMSGLDEIVRAARCIQETLGDAEGEEQSEGTISESGVRVDRVVDCVGGVEGDEEQAEAQPTDG